MGRNLLKTAAVHLHEKMQEFAAETVLYITADGFEFECLAVCGQMNPDLEDSNGLVLRTTTHDFSIAQTYFNDNKPSDPLPRRGERIIQVVNGRSLEFVVNSDGFATTPEEFSDAYGVAFRIHTRLEGSHAVRCDDWTPPS